MDDRLGSWIVLQSGEDVDRQRRQALDQMLSAGTHPGLLIVIDYVEGQQHELFELVARIRKLSTAATPVRLAVLSRTAGRWWTALLNETPALRAVFRDGPTAVPTPRLQRRPRALRALPYRLSVDSSPTGLRRRGACAGRLRTPPAVGNGYRLCTSVGAADAGARDTDERCGRLRPSRRTFWRI